MGSAATRGGALRGALGRSDLLDGGWIQWREVGSEAPRQAARDGERGRAGNSVR
uniref:Uncharacterized protein n=1 Tax=Arundo donax TaxID=35708 RepID=A0A0A9CGC8_ARUDO